MTTNVQKFEKGLAQEMDGWMWNFARPISFICKKAVDGEIDFTLDPKSTEFKHLVISLANEFYTEDDDYVDIEAIEVGINAIAVLASGDRGEIDNQVLVDFEDETVRKSFHGLTMSKIVQMFKGKPIEAAKAIANAVYTPINNGKVVPLPYPHS